MPMNLPPDENQRRPWAVYKNPGLPRRPASLVSLQRRREKRIKRKSEKKGRKMNMMSPILLVFAVIVCGAVASPECVCTLELNPVCGEDGVTYDTSCLATCKGAIVSHEGPCEGHTAAPEEHEENHGVTESHDEVHHQEGGEDKKEVGNHTEVPSEVERAEHKEDEEHGEGHREEGQGHTDGDTHGPPEEKHDSEGNDSDDNDKSDNDKSDSNDSDSHSEPKDD